MSNENEFETGGVKYVAVEKARSMSRCSYCSFRNDLQCIDDVDIPDCDANWRVDGVDVIFVEKHQ